MDIIRVLEKDLAQKTERFLVEALKPNGFAYDPKVPIPVLKDRLAWLTWSNLMRDEQPTFIAKEKENIIGVLVGEPTETVFDIGESEVQDIIILPEFNDAGLNIKLMENAIKFYKEGGAKQVHVWALESGLETREGLTLKALTAIELGFNPGKKVISKWRNVPVVKLEMFFN